MDTVQSEIDAETDATARKNMSTALKELQDNLASGFKDYAYYLNSQYETRILDKYSEALGDALPEITDEELNARYNRLVSLDISKYTDEEAYASALESTSDIYYHTTQGYSQVRSILLKFTDEQTEALLASLPDNTIVRTWATIRDFLHEVAAVIKQHDPNHLVESGTFAGWAYEGYENYRAMHDNPNIDVGNLHEYDYDYQESNTIESPHFEPCL